MPTPTQDSRDMPLSAEVRNLLAELAAMRRMAVTQQVILNASDTPIIDIIDNIYVPLVQDVGYWENLKRVRDLGGFNREFLEQVQMRFLLGPSDYNLGNNRVQTGENGFAIDDPVRFEEHDVLPTPLAPATTYFILAKPNSGSVTISTTVQGAELDITNDGTGVNVIRFALTAALNSLETAIEAVIDQIIADVPVTPTTLELRARQFNKALDLSTDGLSDAVLSPAQTAAIRTDLASLVAELEAPV